ncbi:hypothetical protein BAZSYMA_ACONTIG126469_2 [Bathymodiolus azoricus thioautotrophic gill symbiont]|uniref:Uncharacterized protein n=1 Tax=Bathymodiolus azoricus thioautotrophic gill symbiont TaxID=235205 RepID=A0A1H6MJN4_9GAMM|nr:hypothetical protein BAZSYMA_ACONTIG126469_2 [Bathymodiolus azoricus thioautotrophic gill symbiont]
MIGIFYKLIKRSGLRINSGNFDNTTHYFSFNFWCILNISLNKIKII